MLRNIIVAALAFLAVNYAKSDQINTQSEAVKLAEQFIRSNKYTIQRECPQNLVELDKKDAYDMQPHCRNYSASEAMAFAVYDAEIFWSIYFRKVPPDIMAQGKESFRIIQVFRNGDVRLHDIELMLNEGAVLLQE